MNKYIDADKLIAEIERRRKQRIKANDKIAKGEIFTDAEDEFNSSLARYGNRLVYQELFEIICFIEFLQQEQPEEYESLPKVREWMAGQGVTCEGVIFGNKYFRHKNVEMHLSDEKYDKVGDFGDKVIVQIRKK